MMRGWCALFVGLGLHAETGRDAWLRYAPRPVEGLPAVVVTLPGSVLITTAADELRRGVRQMTGKTLRGGSGIPVENAFILGTLESIRPLFTSVTAPLSDDAFWLKTLRAGGVEYTIVTAKNDRGVLYGTFAMLRKIALGQSIANLDERQSPRAPVRWVNQWDRLDGSIERGYGGRSIFWDGGQARSDLSRVGEYGRLLASLGINGCAINNVNADPQLLSADGIEQVKAIARAFRPWGVRTVISVDFGSPKTVGGLDTFDPLDPRVAAWWKTKIDELYAAVPDLAGVVMKADSEGRVGPSAYGRTHADAANVVAKALKPHGGLIFYRGFVYDHHMDWNDPKNDRARAAYDNFAKLDGTFDGNVVIQVKNGPIDFQVREPVSPLFGALEKTNLALELQVTQEYMGQARHMVFLVPQWKEVLDFEMGNGPVKARARAFAGVANVGLDDSWFGNQMSQANLYGFGRLAWNPDLSAQQIVDEWTRLTFGGDPKVVQTVSKMQLSSWRAYENYTGPLGLQTLTDIVGNHYGVAVEASEKNGWGQWHRADEKGVGMDRTEATGTGFIGQYRAKVARTYEARAACPDDLLLFFHHVPYTYKLHSGKTVIQSIYDSHYEGAEAVEGYVRDWKELAGKIDERRYAEVSRQLEYQAGQAQVWRDAVSNWFLRASGIADAKGRVGNHPGRVEAEAMTLDGYEITPVTPWEGASGGKAVACGSELCSASFRYHGEPGWRTIRVQYFDQNNGVARYRLLVAGQLVDQWAADDRIPTQKVDSASSTRRTVTGIALRTGDEIRIEGVPSGHEVAAIDYVEIH